jgi:hypothetical protein
MRTEGTVAASEKAYGLLTGILTHHLVRKHNCLSCIDANDCHEVLQGPSVGRTSVFVPY